MLVTARRPIGRRVVACEMETPEQARNERAGVSSVERVLAASASDPVQRAPLPNLCQSGHRR